MTIYAMAVTIIALVLGFIVFYLLRDSPKEARLKEFGEKLEKDTKEKEKEQKKRMKKLKKQREEIYEDNKDIKEKYGDRSASDAINELLQSDNEREDIDGGDSGKSHPAREE